MKRTAAVFLLGLMALGSAQATDLTRSDPQVPKPVIPQHEPLENALFASGAEQSGYKPSDPLGRRTHARSVPPRSGHVLVGHGPPEPLGSRQYVDLLAAKSLDD